ncbi:lysophosphatidic acid receptor 3-like [Antedon mediterranea]|uniref:lysophosphatidic acid receptor 3-like n=1 Tax=Antedon mediterranea TaxID=105859 RepID=UPI003AF69C9A
MDNINERLLFNNSVEVHDYHIHYIVFSVIVFTLLPIVLIGNGLIVAVVCKFQSLQEPSYMLLASLAISDFISGILYSWCMIIVLVSDTTSAVNLMLVLPIGNVLVFQWCTSQLHIVALALIRYWCIMQPFKYLQVTKRRALILCVGVWVMGISIGGLFYVTKQMVFANGTPTNLIFSYSVYIILRLVMFGLAITVTLALHFRVYREAKRHSRQIAATTSSSAGVNVGRIDFRAAKTTSRILRVYLLCITPAIVISITLVFPIPVVYDFVNVYALVFIQTGMINALANPLIYARADKKFRHAIGKLFHIRR